MQHPQTPGRVTLEIPSGMDGHFGFTHTGGDVAVTAQAVNAQTGEVLHTFMPITGATQLPSGTIGAIAKDGEPVGFCFGHSKTTYPFDEEDVAELKRVTDRLKSKGDAAAQAMGYENTSVTAGVQTDAGAATTELKTMWQPRADSVVAKIYSALHPPEVAKACLESMKKAATETFAAGDVKGRVGIQADPNALIAHRRDLHKVHNMLHMAARRALNPPESKNQIIVRALGKHGYLGKVTMQSVPIAPAAAAAAVVPEPEKTLAAEEVTAATLTGI